jgi:hypothetical protein
MPIAGLGFRRGSYKCVCRRGFYFPDVRAVHPYYNGTVLEEEYEKLLMVRIFCRSRVVFVRHARKVADVHVIRWLRDLKRK